MSKDRCHHARYDPLNKYINCLKSGSGAYPFDDPNECPVYGGDIDHDNHLNQLE